MFCNCPHSSYNSTQCFILPEIASRTYLHWFGQTAIGCSKVDPGDTFARSVPENMPIGSVVRNEIHSKAAEVAVFLVHCTTSRTSARALYAWSSRHVTFLRLYCRIRFLVFPFLVNICATPAAKVRTTDPQSVGLHMNYLQTDGARTKPDIWSPSFGYWALLKGTC